MADRLPDLTLIGAGPSSVRLEVRYSPAEAVEGSQPHLQSLCQILVANSARGGFPAAARSVDNSNLTLVDEATTTSGEVIHVLTARSLDVRAFQCLRNMVRHLRRERLAVKRIVVTDVDRAGDRAVNLEWPTEENEAEAYPGLGDPARSVFVHEGAEFAKSRRCLVEVAARLEAGQVEAFEDWVQPWYQLIEAGGFSMPLALPEEAESIAGSVSQADENSIEVAVRRFLSSEQGWNPLANMTEAFWRSSNALRRVVIE